MKMAVQGKTLSRLKLHIVDTLYPACDYARHLISKNQIKESEEFSNTSVVKFRFSKSDITDLESTSSTTDKEKRQTVVRSKNMYENCEKRGRST